MYCVLLTLYSVLCTVYSDNRDTALFACLCVLLPKLYIGLLMLQIIETGQLTNRIATPITQLLDNIWVADIRLDGSITELWAETGTSWVSQWVSDSLSEEVSEWVSKKNLRFKIFQLNHKVFYNLECNSTSLYQVLPGNASGRVVRSSGSPNKE